MTTPTHAKSSLQHTPNLILIMLGISAMLMSMVACQGQQGQGGKQSNTSSGVAQLERRALIGPSLAKRLGYRMMWQMPGDGHELLRIRPDQDAVFLLDKQNYLTRINRKTGQRIWQKEVLEPATRVLGMNYTPSLGFVHVMTQGDIYVLNAANGSVIRRDELTVIAATPGVLAGPYVLYGARSGRLVWYDSRVGFLWKGYTVSSHIRLRPQVVNGKVVVVGSGGVVMCLDARSAVQNWSARMLNEITVLPAVTDTTIFVAGLDQHLRAFDLQSGSVLWSKIFETPLGNPPIVIDDQLYISIPGLGLVSYDAQPVAKGVGKELWNAKDVSGNVVGQHGGNVLVWNEQTRRLTLVERAHGTIVDRVDLPNITTLRLDQLINGTLYAADRNGTVIQLAPRSN